MKEFPHKNWKKGGLRKLLNKIDSTGSIDRVCASGRPKSATKDENNVNAVKSLFLVKKVCPEHIKVKEKLRIFLVFYRHLRMLYLDNLWD